MAPLLSGGRTHKAAAGRISPKSERDWWKERLGALDSIG